MFATEYAVIGVAICWDQWFPEAARSMALQGAEVYSVWLVQFFSQQAHFASESARASKRLQGLAVIFIAKDNVFVSYGVFRLCKVASHLLHVLELLKTRLCL